jgi:hypothetical protein
MRPPPSTKTVPPWRIAPPLGRKTATGPISVAESLMRPSDWSLQREASATSFPASAHDAPQDFFRGPLGARAPRVDKSGKTAKAPMCVGEHNAQKLNIARCAGCADKRATVFADP